MNPQTFSINQNLSSLVQCYWVLEGQKDQMPEKNTIVPDGCIKMIFHYGNLYKHYTDDKKVVDLPKCFVIGQLTRPFEVGPIGHTGIFIVRFHPDGFSPFTTIPLRDLENKAVPLTDIFGTNGQMLENSMLKAISTSERILLIEKFLQNRLNMKKRAANTIRFAVDTILTVDGQITIEELTDNPSINRRQLERVFQSLVGLRPKQLAKVVRLQAALKMMLNKDFTNLTTLAHQNEYYDQAHFNRDFKQFTGLTPKEFYGYHLKMTLIFDKS